MWMLQTIDDTLYWHKNDSYKMLPITTIIHNGMCQSHSQPITIILISVTQNPPLYYRTMRWKSNWISPSIGSYATYNNRVNFHNTQFRLNEWWHVQFKWKRSKFIEVPCENRVISVVDCDYQRLSQPLFMDEHWTGSSMVACIERTSHKH